MPEETKHTYLSQYLQKNKIQVKLSVYYSGMSEFVVNVYRILSVQDAISKKSQTGELIADARASTLEEALLSLEPVAQALLSKEADKPWKKTAL